MLIACAVNLRLLIPNAGGVLMTYSWLPVRNSVSSGKSRAPISRRVWAAVPFGEIERVLARLAEACGYSVSLCADCRALNICTGIALRMCSFVRDVERRSRRGFSYAARLRAGMSTLSIRRGISSHSSSCIGFSKTS